MKSKNQVRLLFNRKFILSSWVETILISPSSMEFTVTSMHRIEVTSIPRETSARLENMAMIGGLINDFQLVGSLRKIQRQTAGSRADAVL